MNCRFAIAACLAFGAGANVALSQDFAYASNPKFGASGLRYSTPDPAPRMMEASQESVERPYSRRGYASPPIRERIAARPRRYFDPNARRPARDDFYRTANAEPIPRGIEADPFPEEIPTGDDSQPPWDEQEQYEADYEYNDGEPCGECLDGCPSFGNWGPLAYFNQLHDKVASHWLFGPELWQNFNEYGGVQAFKGPVDRGVNGNFGFHKGVNWASPLWDAMGIGCQLGTTIAFSDIDGGGGLVNRRRDQYFVTGGLFRRANCNRGLQGGAVVDYLHDEFYVRMNLLQVRAETSFILCGHEVGVWAAAHTKSDTERAPAFLQQRTVTWQTNDQYNLFYRYRFTNGATGRSWVGLSSHGDVLFGSDATAPLSERWAIQASYNYLWPKDDPTVPKAIKETWGMAVSLVWYPGYKVPNACFNPYRPLFMVADNGSMMITEKR